MNQYVPDWGTMGDTSRPLDEDDDLIELLWCNGHVVMQSQTHRKPPRPEKAPAAASAETAQEDEATLWFPFTVADSLEKDLFSELFCETSATADADKSCKEVPAGEEKSGGAGAMADAERGLMPPPKSTHASGSRQQQTMSAAHGDNAGDLSNLLRARTAGSGMATKEAGTSSMLSAIGSSICGSNQVQTQRAVSDTGRAGHASDTAHGSALPSAVGSTIANASARALETTVASSSGRSNGCFTPTEPTSTSNRSSKRKRMDTEESESPSEDAESESLAVGHKPPQKLTTARRSRAAEVHNLSERMRRDRINEKMRALQELIPHCNKTDKASMLDEAIEYLKSLQLQVQMMWMGSGIAPPVMFPGVHQYLPRMGVGMGAAAMPTMQRMPFMTQPVVPNTPVNPIPLCTPQVHPSAGFRGHMPAMNLPEPTYAHYLGVNHLQPPSQHYMQGVSFYPLGAKTVQQNPTLAVPSGSLPATTPGAFSSEHTPHKRSG